MYLKKVSEIKKLKEQKVYNVNGFFELEITTDQDIDIGMLNIELKRGFLSAKNKSKNYNKRNNIKKVSIKPKINKQKVLE